MASYVEVQGETTVFLLVNNISFTSLFKLIPSGEEIHEPNTAAPVTWRMASAKIGINYN